MAIEDLGVVDEKDLAASPLNPKVDPIAELLGKIPGIGPFLKGVQQQTSPKGFYGPGVVAQVLGSLSGAKPEDIYRSGIRGFGGINQLETAADMAGSMVAPGASGAARIGGAALMPMLLHLLGGNVDKPGEGLIKGALGAVTQGATEGVMTGAKQIGMHRLAKQARARHADDVLETEGRIFDDLAGEELQAGIEKRAHEEMVNALRSQDAKQIRQAKLKYLADKKNTIQGWEQQVAAQKAAYELAKKSHTEQAATTIMRDAKSVIPWWQEMTEDVPGVVDAVTGKGQRLLSEGYDTAMEQAMDLARNTPLDQRTVQLRLEDMTRLRIPMLPDGIPGPARTGGVAPDGTNPTMGVADAVEVIDRLTHRPSSVRNDWGLYHRVVDALDTRDLGIDPAARESYKAGMGIIQAIDSTGGIKHLPGGKYTLDPQAILDGMAKVKNIDVIRKRGLGDSNTAPFMQALRTGEPEIPAEIPKPYIDPFVAPLKSDIPPPPRRDPFITEELPLSPDETGEILGPLLGARRDRMFAGAGVGGLAGLATGTGSPYHMGGMGTLGAILGYALPNQWVTKAPGDEPLKALIGDLSKMYGGAARQGTLGAANRIGLTAEDVTPEDRAEIEAEKARRLKALEEEGIGEPQGLELLLGELAR